jgi:hypothetical protein
MRSPWWLFVLVACNGSSTDDVPRSTPAARPHPPDPLGPCAKYDGRTCLARDAMFALTIDAPIVTLPAVSDTTKRYAVRVRGTGAKIELSCTLAGAGRVAWHGWEPAGDLWSEHEDAFTGAGSDASFAVTLSPAAGVDEHILVEGDVEFRARIAAGSAR